MTPTQQRHPLEAGQPNLIDERPSYVGAPGVNGPIYRYLLNADGSVSVRAMWAGLGDGIGASGRRFATLEMAAAAVRVAREKVARSWQGPRRKRPVIPFTLTPEGRAE